MSPEASEILGRALQLSAGERDFIILRLMESINPPPNSYASEEELMTEIKRRIEDIESGKVQTYTLEETIAHIREAGEKRRNLPTDPPEAT